MLPAGSRPNGTFPEIVAVEAPSLNVLLAAFSTSSTTAVYLDRCQRALVDEETFALCKYITNNNKGVAEPLHMGCGEISFDVEHFLPRVSLFS